MKKLIPLLAILIFTSLSLEANETNLWPAEKILRSQECIFEIVAKKMNVQISPSKKRPALKVQGTISLEEYQDAMEKFWEWRPSGIINAFNPVTNEIYLYAGAEYYLSRERTIFDSLVHEFSHYFQLNYLGRDLDDEYNENEAVEIQTWFRSEYASFVKGFEFNCPHKSMVTMISTN